MKIFIIALIISFGVQLAEANTRLDAIQKNILEAKGAPFLIMPYYAWKINKTKLPHSESDINEWLKKDCQIARIKRENKNNPKTNSDVLNEASNYFAEKNTSQLIASNTFLNSLIFGATCFGAQCLYSRYTGQPVDKQWTGLAAGFGAAWSLICHGSMTPLENKTKAIIKFEDKIYSRQD